LKQYLKTVAVALGLLVVTWAGSAEASMLVGNSASASNDMEADVLAVIVTYNTANDPDLPTDLTAFKKSDDDAAFVFDAANGFTFWDAPTGGSQITSDSALHTRTDAWFTYTGPADLTYYSVKNGNIPFSVHLYMSSGRNHIDLAADPHDPNTKDISHVTFWTTAAGEVPEPAALAGLAGLALAAGVRRGPRRA